MRDGLFVPASRLYDVETRTPIAHPAHQATDEQVRRAVENPAESTARYTLGKGGSELRTTTFDNTGKRGLLRLENDGSTDHTIDENGGTRRVASSSPTRASAAAIAFACNDVDELVAAARRVLERDDLTIEQRREIAETFSTRAVSFVVETSVTVTTKGDK